MITPTGLGQTSMIIQTVFGVTASYLNASQGVYIDLPSSSAWDGNQVCDFSNNVGK